MGWLAMKSVCVKIINLAHRTDRRNECLEELNNLDYGETHNIFFDAKLSQNSGELGCAISHAMALSEFLFYDERPFALILEDDFHVLNRTSFFWNHPKNT